MLYLGAVAQTSPSSNTTNKNENTPGGIQTPPENIITPPGPVNNRFGLDYPNNNPSWQREGNYFSARYKDNTTNRDRVIIYDGNGNIIRTENELDPNNYPSTIGGYYTKHYPNEGYIIWMSEDNTGKKAYYIIRNNERIWFDENGNYTEPQTTKNK